ncbi:hypothetical protein MTO96_020614 [Rhipicephalus appendiculatus]
MYADDLSRRNVWPLSRGKPSDREIRRGLPKGHRAPTCRTWTRGARETCSAGLDLAIACLKSASVAKLAWQTRGSRKAGAAAQGWHAALHAHARAFTRRPTQAWARAPARLQPWALAPQRAGVMRLRDSMQEASAFTVAARRSLPCIAHREGSTAGASDVTAAEENALPRTGE